MNNQPLLPPRTIIVTEHFQPSTGATAQLISDLTDGLVSKGNQIIVLTSTPGPSSTIPGLLILRSTGASKIGVSVLSKALSGLKFAAWSLYSLLAYARRGDSLLIVSNPPFIGVVGLLTKLLKGSKYIYLFQDLFPRSAQLTGVLPSRGPVSDLWSLLLCKVCKHSEKTIVLSEAMNQRCQKEYHLSQESLAVIHNWAVETALPVTKAQNPVAQDWCVTNKFTIQYSGNFGRLHEIITLLEAARLLADEDVHFIFVGGGAKQSQILQYINYYSLANVKLYPYQKREVLPYSLGACDISAIGLIPGSEDTVAPSKFYGIIASGKPVLLLARHTTDIARLILDNNCGYVVDPGDPLDVVSKIRYLSKNPHVLADQAFNARALYSRQFSLQKSVDMYHELLQSLL